MSKRYDDEFDWHGDDDRDKGSGWSLLVACLAVFLAIFALFWPG